MPLKNIPAGDSRPIAFCSCGRSLVVIREERWRLKYWAIGDLGCFGEILWCGCGEDQSFFVGVFIILWVMWFV